MGNVKQIKIKNHTSYFFNDMINIKGFDSRLDEFIEAKNENKYLVFDSTDENKEVLKNTQNFGMGLKMRLRQKHGEYGKDFKKIKFSSGYDMPLNKPLNFLPLAIVVRSVFEEDGKFYPQIYLDGCLYEL